MNYIDTDCPCCTCREREEKSEIWKNRQSYSLPVRIGNWNDEVLLNDEKVRLTKYKRDHCQLLLQKTKLMFQNLLYAITLSNRTEYVFYNEWYQIKSPELPNKVHLTPGETPSLGLYLSGLINEQVVEYAQNFVSGCPLTASPDRVPCVRNAFKFLGCNVDKTGQSVYFGDDVYITISSDGNVLYLSCEPATLENMGGHLNVHLTNVPDMYCRFKFYHYDPQQRVETTGSSFTPNSKVIIKHSATGRNLAAEYNSWIPTFFSAECTVSCHTFQDSHHMETAENIWMIVGDMRPDLQLYVRAAKGEDIPEEMLL